MINVQILKNYLKIELVKNRLKYKPGSNVLNLWEEELMIN